MLLSKRPKHDQNCSRGVTGSVNASSDARVSQFYQLYVRVLASRLTVAKHSSLSNQSIIYFPAPTAQTDSQTEYLRHNPPKNTGKIELFVVLTVN